MKLTIDFVSLKAAVDQMGPSDIIYNLDYFIVERTKGLADELAPFSYLSEGLMLGDDILVDKIKSDCGVFDYMGHQVMLYLQDQGSKVHDVLKNGAEGGRIHIAECKIFEDLKNKEKLAGYGVISRMDALFPVRGFDQETKNPLEGKASLLVCQNCLEILNYKGYIYLTYSKKKILSERFDFEGFFETYSSHFKSIFAGTQKNLGVNGDEMAAFMREEMNYTCEHCSVYLKEKPTLLQLHHINGLLSDNKRINLKLYCADCNKKQPHGGYLHVKHTSILEINRRRKEQNIFEPSNYQKLEQSADSALSGLISKCRKHNLPVGELGLYIRYGNKIIDIDLAWSRKKIAVLIDLSEQEKVEADGWHIFSAHQALSNFDFFQKKIR